MASIDLTGYKLTFDDEFNTASISQTGAGKTYADIRPGFRFDANSDIGFGKSSFIDAGSGYNPFSVQNGALSITAAPPGTTSSGYPGSWQSGLITTQGNFSQTYGYFEMRADFSNNPNAWDAFWMEPNQQSSPSNTDASHQELDVVEHYGANDPGVYSTIHTTDPQPANVPWQADRQVYSEMANPSGYHTYGVDWQPDTLTFYVDGQEVGSQATPSDMHSPMCLMADLGVQSSAGWQIGVLHHTHKLVMAVHDEMLEEMVPVSPKPFAALQTAMAGRSFPALEGHDAPDGSTGGQQSVLPQQCRQAALVR